MTILAVSIAALLVIFALAGLAAEPDLAAAPSRVWIRSAMLAATALFLGLAIRGPTSSPTLAGALDLAPVWHLLLVSMAIVLTLIACLRSSDVRTLGTGLTMAVLTLAAGLVQPSPLAATLLAGCVGLLGIPALLESTPPTAQMRAAVRCLVFFGFAALALVAATILAGLTVQAGHASLIGPAVGLLAVAALTIAGAFPFHIWLPPLAEHGPRYGTITTVGLAQVAGFGAVMTVIVAMPWLLADPAQPTWLILAAISGLFSAALALGETHPRRAAAHLLGLQGAMVVAGIASRNSAGMAGALILLLALGPTLLLVLAESNPTTASDEWSRRTIPSAIGRASLLGKGIGWLSLLGLPPTLTFWGRSLIVTAIFAIPSAESASDTVGPGFPAGSIAALLLIVAQVLAIATAVRHASVVFGDDDGEAEIGKDSLADSPSSVLSSQLVRVAVATVVVVCGLLSMPVVGAIEQALRGLPLE